jgi:pyruvate/2-oxoglutarate dehydrogenase complex dihydrolipoamide dehydrogenase (E3) component
MKYDYDIVVIGAGSAGTTAAEFAALFGKKVAIVTKDRIGGDCLWTGCVPSKSLIHVARECFEKGDQAHGSVYFERAVKHILHAQETIRTAHDNPEYFTQKGIAVLFGAAKFLTPHKLQVGDHTITSKFFLIATGSRPVVPVIAGIEETAYLTNETIFTLDHLPSSMIILGGGPIGCELAQAFARLGTSVTIVQRNERLLPKDEADVSALILETFRKEHISVYLNTQVQTVRIEGSSVVVQLSGNDSVREITADTLIVSIGRRANVENLGLEEIGVKVGKNGILHDSELKTTHNNIYVAGDVAGDFVFTHFAARQATAAVQNMVLPFDTDFEPKAVPWVTFTSPEVAAVGVREEGKGVQRISFPYAGIDRAIADENTVGFIHLYIRGNMIVGATIVGERAGEMIHEVCLAIECGAPLGKVMGMIHAYPTYSLGIQQALFEHFSQYNSFRLKLGKFLAKFT